MEIAQGVEIASLKIAFAATVCAGVCRVGLDRNYDGPSRCFVVLRCPRAVDNGRVMLNSISNVMGWSSRRRIEIARQTG